MFSYFLCCFIEHPPKTRRGFTETSRRIHSQRTHRGLTEDLQRAHRESTEDSQRIHRRFTEDLQRTHRGLLEDSHKRKRVFTEDSQRIYKGLTEDLQSTGDPQTNDKGPRRTEDSQKMRRGLTEDPDQLRNHRGFTEVAKDLSSEAVLDSVFREFFLHDIGHTRVLRGLCIKPIPNTQVV